MRVAHLSHHDGCIRDFEYVGQRLGLDVRSYRYDNGYNIGPERADRSWERWQERLAEADVVFTSDTAPLARIVLQHLDEYPGHVVVWVCNRFDYGDRETNDCGFPDPAYYELIRAATRQPRVHFVSYTAFERVYAAKRGVDLGDRVIKPLGRLLPSQSKQLIPAEINKPETVFVPPYHNDTILMDLADRVANLDARVYCGRYGGPDELREFKALVHVPYAWSTFAFFEQLQNGVPMLVPGRWLMLRLARNTDFFWQQADMLLRFHRVSEWYSPEHTFLVYFRTWRDLGMKLHHLNLEAVREEMRAFAERHTEVTLRAWRQLFDGIAGA